MGQPVKAIRHDRSVIDAHGGVWPRLADSVRQNTLRIIHRPPNSHNERVKKARDRRRALGLTQVALSKRLGNDQAAVSHWENGEVRRSEEWMQRLEAALAAAEAERS